MMSRGADESEKEEHERHVEKNESTKQKSQKRAARLALGPYVPYISVHGPIRDVASYRAEYRPTLESPTHGIIRALLLGLVLM